MARRNHVEAKDLAQLYPERERILQFTQGYYDLSRDRIMSPLVMQYSLNLTAPRGVIKIIQVNDLHLFSNVSNPRFIKETLDPLVLRDDTFLLLCGDNTDSATPEHPNTGINTVLTPDQQAKGFIKVLQPYADDHRIIGAVSGAFHHTDWPDVDYGTRVTWEIVKDFTGPDGNPVPVFYNGGVLYLCINGSHPIPIDLLHNPGGGTTKDPTQTLQTRMIDLIMNGDTHLQRVRIAGHKHESAGASTYSYFDPVENMVVTRFACQGGTNKGIDPEGPPDQLAEARGRADAPQSMGGGFIIRSTGDKQASIHMTFGFPKLTLVQQALEVLNQAERLGSTDEELGHIYARQQAEARFNPSESVKANAPPEYQTPVHRKASFTMVENPLGRIPATQLPFGVVFFSHALWGANTRNSASTQELIDIVKNSPRLFSLFGNLLLNSDVPDNVNRVPIFNQMLEAISSISERQRLAMMLDSVLRHNSWLKTKKYRDDNGEKFISDPLITADFITNYPRMKNTIMYMGGGIIILRQSSTISTVIKVADGTAGYGQSRSLSGLMGWARVTPGYYNVIIGGNSPTSGVLTTPSQVVISPGWNGEATNNPWYGKTTRFDVSPGGQGFIIMPEGEVIGCANLQELQDLHRGTILLTELTTKGKLDSFMRRRPKKKI